jgi:hypothetical protein
MQKISSFFEYLLENGQEAYREHFREILAEEGYSSIADIPAEKKAEFFAKVSKTWKDKKANESILREYAELCPVCHGHSTPEKEHTNDKKCKGCGNYVHIESHAAVEESDKPENALKDILYDTAEKISQEVDVSYTESEGKDVLRIDFPNETSVWLYANKQAEGHVSSKVKKILDKEGFKFTEL